jgi:exopolysaccharide biosynthesis polyprenyl glycosylphosphotransferase
MLLDTVMINVGFVISFWLLWPRLATPRNNIGAYWHLLALISIAVPLIFQLMDLYRDWLRRPRPHVVYSIVVAVAMTSLVTMACGFWFRQFAFPRTVLLVAAAIQIVLIGGYRSMGRKAYRFWFGGRTTVVVGESEEAARAVAAKFEVEQGDFYRIERCISRKRLCEPYDELDTASIVILTAGVTNKNDIILHCFRYHKEVLIVPSISELTSFRAESRVIQDLLVFGVHPYRVGPAEELMKRAIDLVGSIVLLILTSPFFLVLSIAIPLTSKGPVFFRQERIGKGRKLFWVLKFRTMVQDAEQHSGPVLATARDPRITSLGHVLRGLRLDELPQLWNVLCGDMSLIGPRPEREFFVEQFEQRLPAYEFRHSVKPGITGLAQVMGRYSTVVDQKLDFDLLYIYSYSLLLDFKILLQTVIVVLRREQSAGASPEIGGKQRFLPVSTLDFPPTEAPVPAQTSTTSSEF